MFGATERMRFPSPGGTIAHAEIQIGDSVIMVDDEDPRRGTSAPPAGGLPGSPAFLYIYVADVDAVISTAVELGANCGARRRTSSTVSGTGTSSTPSGIPYRIPDHDEQAILQQRLSWS